MRVWDVPVEFLCNQHLLGEHNEIHVLYKTVLAGKGGWWHHVETRRWKNTIDGLVLRHDQQVEEMKKRGWTGHKTPLQLQGTRTKQVILWQSIPDQIEVLKTRKCACRIQDMIDWYNLNYL